MRMVHISEEFCYAAKDKDVTYNGFSQPEAEIT